MLRRRSALSIAGLAAFLLTTNPLSGQDGFRFRSGVDLINVTATVTDRSGRFASGLTLNDFVVYEDDRPMEVTHFSAERVPVSLGIVLDTSGSMQGEKIENALAAIERFLDRQVQTTRSSCTAFRTTSSSFRSGPRIGGR